MYNCQQKESYIDAVIELSLSKEAEKNRIAMINFFNRLEVVEDDIGKDFSMMNFDEIKLVLSVLCRRTIKYQITVISNLKRYLQWCITNGCSLDRENRLICIKPTDVDYSLSHKMSMVKDEEQLGAYLDIVLKVMKEETSDNMYRTILYLVFSGFNLSEIIEITDDKVDIENGTIRHNENLVQLSEKCIEIVKYYKGMTHFVAAVGNNSERSIEIIKTGHLIERTVKSRISMKETLSVSISNIFTELKEHEGHLLSITLNNLWLSGVFYRMYEKEVSTGMLCFDEYLMKFQDSINGAYSPSIIEDECRLEYERWKKAFGL